MPQVPPAFNQPMRFPVPTPQQQPRQKPKDTSDWTLMTPAEILGVESNDKLLKSKQQRDYDKEREGKTPLEKFLKRQSEAQMGISNQTSRLNPAFDWDASSLGTRQDPFQSQSDLKLKKSRKDSGNFLRSSIEEWTAIPQKRADDNLASSSMPAAPDSLGEAASFEHFQNLLSAAASAETAAKPPKKTFSAIQPLPDLGLSQPQTQVNPLGTSYKPLESGVASPVGAVPMPTLSTPAVAPTVATPSWAPKPAPWITKTPQPFAIPQRQF